MSDKGDVSKIESAGTAAPPLTFGQKLKNHYKRFWWAHLGFLIASVLIITLCLVYVGFPNIAQSQVNGATLNVTSQVVTDATPDSVRLQIDSVSKSDSIYHPELDAFSAAFSLARTSDPDSALPPFGHVTIPSIVSGSAVPIFVNQTLKITNMNSFIQYNIAVISQETFYTYVSGDINLHEGALPTTTVSYNKIVTMKGLNGLAGFKVQGVKISIKSKLFKNVSGKVYIPNPSVLTIDLGTAYLDLYVDGKLIGFSVIENLVLKPGDNHFDMWGHSDTNKVLPLLSKYKKDNYILPIDIKGNRSMVNGKEIPYFSAAIQHNELHTKLDIKKALV